jgi:mannose-6-phosphate isomerase-like protein (cupin superfamily)
MYQICGCRVDFFPATAERKLRTINQSDMRQSMKKSFAVNLEEETRTNMDFCRVLYMGKYCQVVLICLRPWEDPGIEIHDYVDQFFRIEKGDEVVVIDTVRHAVMEGMA